MSIAPSNNYYPTNLAHLDIKKAKNTKKNALFMQCDKKDEKKMPEVIEKMLV
nr:hypothetical protein [uncultured Agathobaculum sp.]